MKSALIRVPRFILAGIVLIITWWLAATTLYGWFAPANLLNFSELGADKRIQDFILSTALFLPGLMYAVVPRIREGIGLKPALFTALGMIALLEVCYFSSVWLMLGFGTIAVYAWFDRERGFPRSERWFGGLVGLLSIGILYQSFHRNYIPVIDLYEDGPWLASVSAFLHGQAPFRDFTIHYGILQEVVKPLFAFRLWGQTYEAYLRMGAWISSLDVLLLFLIVTQTVRRRGWILFMGILLLFRSDLDPSGRALFGALSVLLFCRGLKTKKPLWMAAAGGSAALSVLYSLETGVTLILGMIGYFAVRRLVGLRRDIDDLALWTAGALFTAGIFFLYILHLHAAIPFLRDTCDVLFYRSTSWSDGLPSHLFSFRALKSLALFHPFLYIHHIPFLSVAVIAYVVIKSKNAGLSAGGAAALLMACILFFQFFIYMGRSDFGHWQNSTAFLWPLTVLILEEIFNWARQPASYGFLNRLGAVFLSGVIGLPFIFLMWGRRPLMSLLFSSVPFRSAGSNNFELPANLHMPERLGSIPALPEKLLEVSTITEGIRKAVSPQDYFFDFTNQGGFYFLSDRRNPTRFGLVDEVQGDRMEKECLAALAAHPPMAILARELGRSLVCRADLTPIRDYILKRYRAQQRWGSWVLLVPER